MNLRRGLVVLLLTALVCDVASAGSQWGLWDAYCKRFFHDGRIIDFDRGEITTSEGQAYGMFFALVSNDQERFGDLVAWTEQNLSDGDLGAHLPAWQWGSKAGEWKVLDRNPASDADLWMAYSLLHAGRLWNRKDYSTMGLALASQIAATEVADVPGLGLMLLPGPTGFAQKDTFQFNASYVPVQVLFGMAQFHKSGPWDHMARYVPALLRGSTPAGFVLDWIAYQPKTGFSTSPVPMSPLKASYDAIRVYLWAGMLDPATPNRAAVLDALSGMRDYLRERNIPPAEVSPEGKLLNANGNIGFSAAVMPFLEATGDTTTAEANGSRVRGALDTATGLYGKPAHYYDQNLVMFALGWSEKRFRFDRRGNLIVNWRRT